MHTERDAEIVAWVGRLGAAGAEHVMERFASALGQALSPTGEARIVLSSDGDSRAILNALDSAHLLVREVVARDFGNEVLTVYAVTTA